MFLSKADLFGYSLQPTFKGKSKVNTVLGGVVSLMLVALFTFGFLFVGREIVEKKNPISNISAIGIDNAAIPLREIPMFFAVVSDEGKLQLMSTSRMTFMQFKATTIPIWGLGIGDWAQSPIPNPQSPMKVSQMNKTAILSFILDEVALKCRNVSSNMRKRIHWMLEDMEITVKEYDERALIFNGWIRVGKGWRLYLRSRKSEERSV